MAGCSITLGKLMSLNALLEKSLTHILSQALLVHLGSRAAIFEYIQLAVVGLGLYIHNA